MFFLHILNSCTFLLNLIFLENLTVYQGKIKRDFEGTKKPRQSYKVSRKKRFIRGCERELEEGMERIEFLIKIAGWENDKQIKESAFEKLGEIDSDSEENNSGTENTMNEKIGDTVPEDAVPKESHNSKRCKNESEDSICKKKQKRQERSESRDDIPRRLTRSMTVKPTP
ncbi:hypothetical protein HCN44_000847 [Aphidius gifuensis]|uniref:Odorant-binding protein n=1 Tax=Aphidius gifuensis TaxID=684658 RepID=A0A835CW99_APHGI|nr:hypothetical protein HCN44_000847 [Aphidius gifuensis]